MIPAGRTLITQEDIAALYDMSLRTAQRADPPPWNRPGHPAPVNADRGKTHRKLWDAEQAKAFALGKAVPELPTVPEPPEKGHPEDMLDRPEAAKAAGLSTATWSRYESMERQRTRAEGEHRLVPEPNREFGGEPFWFRRTVETYRAERADPDRKRGGGRPAGTTEKTPRGELAARVAELLNEQPDGEPLSTPEIARRLGVNYRTAQRHVKAHREQNSVASDQHRT
ncbi:hypothetical protein [Amycolatopsis samaneae]|uniref:Uncharacterized protein n=1 Tax=Amycolatopsis samaneae TaxID=664691 RepID=A0ABW5GB00_9PSEU